MPRSNSVTPPGPTVESVSFAHGKKSYTIEGGLNAHGRFARLVEAVGGRRNSIFIDLMAIPQLCESLGLVASRLEGLPETLSPPPPVAG